MFAVAALICFVLLLCGLAALGPISTLALGLVFVAAHLAWPIGVPGLRRTA